MKVVAISFHELSTLIEWAERGINERTSYLKDYGAQDYNEEELKSINRDMDEAWAVVQKLRKETE